jgi:hypothetical protein
MKTTTRLMIGVVAIAMVLSIAFSGVALADLYYYYQPHEVVGKMDYYPCLTDGFIKDMDVDTGSVPNLNVMKSIGYGQGATIGSLRHDEEISMGIVAAPSPTEEVVLCPFASRATEGWWHEVDNNNEPVRLSVLPASCVDVEASSAMVVTEVLATTVTKVDISESPLNLHYQIDATGLGGAGTPAVGHIAAEFEVYTEDGSAWADTHCNQGDPASFMLGSKLTHYEKSTADGLWELDGLWEFHKDCDRGAGDDEKSRWEFHKDCDRGACYDGNKSRDE